MNTNPILCLVLTCLAIIQILFSGCNDDLTFKKVKLKQVRIHDFPMTNGSEPWDSLDGPDLYFEIYLNGIKKYNSNVNHYLNIISVPVTFQIDSEIIAQPGKDQLTYKLFDLDIISLQLIDSLKFEPPASRFYPFDEVLQWGITQWESFYIEP
ncbi:MAG: hypothetical protein WBO44_01710 [Saprospiraceae bacterium]